MDEELLRRRFALSVSTLLLSGSLACVGMFSVLRNASTHPYLYVLAKSRIPVPGYLVGDWKNSNIGNVSAVTTREGTVLDREFYFVWTDQQPRLRKIADETLQP